MNSKLRKIARELSEEEILNYDGNEVDGGLADDMSLKDLADKYGVSVKDLLSELLMGMEIETEHTDDEMIAIEIALDHLYEIPDYYTRLKDMEDLAESEWTYKSKKNKIQPED